MIKEAEKIPKTFWVIAWKKNPYVVFRAWHTKDRGRFNRTTRSLWVKTERLLLLEGRHEFFYVGKKVKRYKTRAAARTARSHMAPGKYFASNDEDGHVEVHVRKPEQAFVIVKITMRAQIEE